MRDRMLDIKLAVWMAHWPGQSVPVCEKHREALDNIADAMGMPPVTCTDIEGETFCTNCLNEYNKQSR